MNYSRQREIILETLKQNVVHPTAEYLYDILRKTHPKISLATLYRNLNQLAQNGIIKKIDGLETSSHFDHNTFEHYHFICSECKRVFDIPADVAIINSSRKDANAQKAEELTDFTINTHDVVFCGICKDCKKQTSNQ